MNKLIVLATLLYSNLLFAGQSGGTVNNTVPEPGVWALLVAGVAAGYFLNRKK